MSHARYDGFCLNTILNDLHHAYALRKLPDNEASKPSFSRFVCHILKVSSDSNTASFWAVLLRGSSMTMIMPQPIAATPFETTPFSAVCRYASWSSTTRFGSILHHQNVAQDFIQRLLSRSSTNTAWSYVGAATYSAYCDYVDCWMTAVPGPRETLVSFRYNRSAIPNDKAASINRLFCDVIAAIYDDPSHQVSGLQPGDLASIRVVPTLTVSHPVEVPPLQDPAAPCTSSLALDDHGQRALSVLTRLWAEALQLLEDSIGSDVDASFFAPGGDSTLAMRLVRAGAATARRPRRI